MAESLQRLLQDSGGLRAGRDHHARLLEDRVEAEDASPVGLPAM